MTIEIPDDILQRAELSPSDILLQLAIALFKEEKLTLGQASELAGMHQAIFHRELDKRQIPIHDGAEDFEADLDATKRLELDRDGEHKLGNGNHNNDEAIPNISKVIAAFEEVQAVNPFRGIDDSIAWQNQQRDEWE